MNGSVTDGGILNSHELVTEIESRIIAKDGKIGIARATRSEWNFAYVNLLITSDEDTITRDMVEAIKGRFDNLPTRNIKEVHLLFFSIKGYPCLRLR